MITKRDSILYGSYFCEMHRQILSMLLRLINGNASNSFVSKTIGHNDTTYMISNHGYIKHNLLIAHSTTTNKGKKTIIELIKSALRQLTALL